MPRIRPVSKRRQRRDAVYNERRKQVFERADGRCEASVHDYRCSGRCEDTHHIAGRLGPDPHRLSNLIGLSSACHAAAHRFPEWARENGLSRSRLAVNDDEGEALPPAGGDAA